MSGLCAAWYLRERFGAGAVRVFEAAGVPGGTARTERAEGFVCEWGPNGFLDKEPRTLAWMAALGIEDRLVRASEASARRFIYRHGRLHEIKPPPGFLFSPLLSVRGRARLLCEPLVKPRRDGGPETIWDFARRRIGQDAADTLVSPMVSGVFGGDAKQLSLEHCFPRMAEMERLHGGLFKAMKALKKSGKSAMGPGGTLTSFRDGIGIVPETAAAALGDSLQLDTPVTRVSPGGDGFAVETRDGAVHRARAVVVAAPAYAASDFCAPMGEDLCSALGRIAYAGIAVVCTGFRREQVRHDLNGFGFLVPRIEGKRVLGCLWTSSLFPGRAPEGHVLLRTMYGGYTDPDVLALGDEELFKLWRSEIGSILGVEGDPCFLRIFRHARGIPQYLTGHGGILNVVEQAERQHPGLVFAGNAYRGVSLNDCVVSAHRAVDMLSDRVAAG